MNLFLLSSLFQAHWPKRTSQNLINPISSLPPIQPPQPGERPGDRRCAVVDSAPPHAVPAVRGPRPAPPPSTPRTATPPGAPDEVEVIAAKIEPKLANSLIRQLSQACPLENLRHVKRKNLSYQSSYALQLGLNIVAKCFLKIGLPHQEY
uniref:Uncharacterized protein n=1 Tax=Oryza meridionalis TaxID=40149 RepID=A0A0E0DB68_9ORYZ